MKKCKKKKAYDLWEIVLYPEIKVNNYSLAFHSTNSTVLMCLFWKDSIFHFECDTHNHKYYGANNKVTNTAGFRNGEVKLKKTNNPQT